ncbi:MAG: FlgD immunoglobulin-like domain containing protein [candidate division Zixibacteria bacterium]|nr:FlgD immunoglobulin-like domain containing protein [candidate division Zixibacteria bacterium]
MTVVVAVLMAPALILAAGNRLAPSKATAGTDNTITIPLEISNLDGLMAMDIPLKFSEGVTLKEVTFENTRTEYFDLKLSNINNEKNTVVIGMISQASGERKPELTAGEGAVANLVFTIDNPAITEVTLEAVKLESPHHSLLFIYREDGANGSVHTRVEPKFENVTVSLSGITPDGMPKEFSLNQNYPNPFNPSTQIAFALPTASKVELSIFNVLGQKVNTVVDGDMPAGNHTVTWDGRNASGSSVSSGVYFYRIVAGSNIQTRKMMMLK